MGESALQPNDRAVWIGALTLGVVGAAMVWTLRLLLPYKGLDLPDQLTGVVGAAVLVCGVVLGTLYALFRSYPVVVSALIVLVSCSAFLVPRAGSRPIVILVTFGAFVVISMIVASEWTNSSMRIMVVVFAVAALALRLRSGRAELEEVRVHDSRGTAVSLYNRLTGLNTDEKTKSDAVPAATGTAYDSAHRALLDAVGGQDLPRPGGCDNVSAGSVDASLCQLAPLLERELRCIGHAAVAGCQADIADLPIEKERVAALRAADTLSAVDLEREEIEKQAEAAGGWQKVYNLACFCAVRSARTGPDDRRTALELLERIFEKDRGGQLTQEWVDRDPDLQNLKQEARFATFRSWLPACPVAATREET